MTETPPTTSVDAALAHAVGLDSQDPKLAAGQARQILAVVPGEPGARSMVGKGDDALRDIARAPATLQRLAPEQPEATRAHPEMAACDARHDESWLDPLKLATGPMLDSYPVTPEDLP